MKFQRNLSFLLVICYIMPQFSKFILGQRGHQQLIDSEGFSYGSRQAKDTVSETSWRCTERKLKCPATVHLDKDNNLRAGSKPHNHNSVPFVTEKKKSLIHLNVKRPSNA